jgi:hypothetical protein
MTGRTVRWSVRIGVATLSVAMVATMAFAAGTWGTSPGGRVGDNWTWNDGPPMAAQLGSKLIAVYDSDYISCGATTDGSGCFMGAYAVRSRDGGATWDAPKRLNPGKIHGERATIAAGSDKACAAYMTQKKYYSAHYATYTFDVNAVRKTYVRCTGNGQKWSAKIALPGQTKTSRGDWPYMAASGTDFYLAMTHTKSGKIDVWHSANDGVTWTGPVVAGATTLKDTATDGYIGGFTGTPAIAATSSKVVVAWQTTGGAAVYALSTDSAGSFGATKSLDSGATNANFGFVNLRADSTRIVAGWSTATAAKIALFGSTTFGSASTVASFPDSQPGINSTTSTAGFEVVPMLGSGSTIGAAWTECNAVKKSGNYCADNYPETGQYSSKIQMSMVYRQSANNGSSWGTASTIIVPSGKNKQFDWSDGLFYGGAPYVFFNQHNYSYGAYNIQLRTCSGC